MKETWTYHQLFVIGYAEAFAEAYAEGFMAGALAGAKKILRLLGDQAFGPPDLRTVAAINRLNDLTVVEDLIVRLRTAQSWRALLGRPGGRRLPARTPGPPRRHG